VTQTQSNIGSGGQPLRSVGETPSVPSLRQRMLAWHPRKRTAKKEPKNSRFGLSFRELTSNVGEILAIGAVSHGAWLITPSAGWIVGGIGLGALAMAVSRTE
jgi:hypothetical protein